MSDKFFPCVCILILGGIGLYGYATKYVYQPKPLPELSMYRKSQKANDAASFLIERLRQPVKGEIVSPKTTAELRAWFSESRLNDVVQRVYVDRLPADFAEQGDKDLFAKIITALILRENERAIKERAVLILLKNKLEQGKEWTPIERTFFDELVQKYDAKAKKTETAQIADMQLKIDAIPPMVAVIQAAEATDWGRKNLESPYEQMAWLDNKTYARRPFKSLIQATESYAKELNGMPPLENWRYLRQHLQGAGYHDIGTRVLRWLGDYKMEDLAYTDKLQQRIDELDYEIPDQVKLEKSAVSLPVGKVMVNGHTFAVEYAETPQEKIRGLMFRASLPENHGMVFLNAQPAPAQVWMRNTFVPLDLVFFDETDTVVGVMPDRQPLDETVVGLSQPVKGFIELPINSIRLNTIQVGDKLEFSR